MRKKESKKRTFPPIPDRISFEKEINEEEKSTPYDAMKSVYNIYVSTQVILHHHVSQPDMTSANKAMRQ